MINEWNKWNTQVFQTLEVLPDFYTERIDAGENEIRD
jgi:hypothetical protein